MLHRSYVPVYMTEPIAVAGYGCGAFVTLDIHVASAVVVAAVLVVAVDEVASVAVGANVGIDGFSTLFITVIIPVVVAATKIDSLPVVFAEALTLSVVFAVVVTVRKQLCITIH